MWALWNWTYPTEASLVIWYNFFCSYYSNDLLKWQAGSEHPLMSSCAPTTPEVSVLLQNCKDLRSDCTFMCPCVSFCERAAFGKTYLSMRKSLLDIHALYRLSWPSTSLPADLSFCQAEYGLIFVKDFLGWTIQPKNRLLGSEKNYLLCCMAKFNLTTVSFLLKPFHLTSCLQAVSWLTGDSSILVPHCQKLWEPIKYHEIWTLLLLYIPASYGITLIKVYGHKDNWKQSSLETFAQDSYL